MDAICKLGYGVIDQLPRVHAEPTFDPIPKSQVVVARVVTPPGAEDHRCPHCGNSPRAPGDRKCY